MRRGPPPPRPHHRRQLALRARAPCPGPRTFARRFRGRWHAGRGGEQDALPRHGRSGRGVGGQNAELR
eukprot:987783-Lingulodinium_polyedra.AAC.1